MADAWDAQLTQHGTAWGVAPAAITGFTTQVTTAKTLFAEVKSGNRTPINTEQCRIAFHDLEQIMRFLKNNFLTPRPAAVTK
jgi:hypothetical protein